MVNGYKPTPADQLIENRDTRRKVYRTSQFIGLGLTIVTAGIAGFGVAPEAFPWLLSAWSVYGVIDAWVDNLAAKNVNV